MSKARDIYNHAKDELIAHIKYEVQQISMLVSGGADDTHVEEEDFLYKPKVMVGVDNSHAKSEDSTEGRSITEIEIGNGRVQIITEEGDDIDANSLTIEELYQIAFCLEKSYFNLVK